MWYKYKKLILQFNGLNICFKILFLLLVIRFTVTFGDKLLMELLQLVLL